MLMESYVKLQGSNGTERNIKVSEAFDMYRTAHSAGGPHGVKLLTYNPIKRSFMYQAPSVFRKINDNNLVTALTLDMGKDKDGQDLLYSVIISTMSKIYGIGHGFPTTISVLGLKTLRTGKMSVAYVNDKNNIEYKPILNVYDPLEAIRNQNLKTVSCHREAQKDGLAVTTEPKLKEIPVFNSVRMETRDSSLFVCDGLLVL